MQLQESGPCAGLGEVESATSPQIESGTTHQRTMAAILAPVFVSAGLASVAVVATGSIALTPKGVLSAGSSRRILDADLSLRLAERGVEHYIDSTVWNSVS
jgi:hypothetical protein